MENFEHIGRKMPYTLAEGNLEALQARIRKHTAQRQPAPRRAPQRLALAALATAAAAVIAILCLLPRQTQTTPESDLEQMLTTTSTKTIRQAAVENYDDIFNPQL